MDNKRIGEISNDLKAALRDLWQTAALEPLVRRLEALFSEMSAGKISLHLRFDLFVYRHDKGVEATPTLRIPLATLSAVRGFGEMSESDSRRMADLSTKAVNDASAAAELERLVEAAAKKPKYEVTFGSVPDLLGKGLQLCPTCQGGGVRLNGS